MTRIEIQNEIQRIKEELVEHYEPERIIFFGSALSDAFTNDSDLDFLVIKRDVPDRGIDRIYEVDRLIERRGVAIDILVYKPQEITAALDDGDPFISAIINNGRTLYGEE